MMKKLSVLNWPFICAIPIVILLLLIAYDSTYHLFPPNQEMVEAQIHQLKNHSSSINNSGEPCIHVIEDPGEPGRGGQFSLLKSSTGTIYLTTKRDLFSNLMDQLSSLYKQGCSQSEILAFEKDWLLEKVNNHDIEACSQENEMLSEQEKE